MLKEGMPYSAADWRVRPGSESEFVGAWNEFIQWTVDHVEGARTFHLLHDETDPGHFVSFGSWESEEARQAWRQDPAFGELFGRCVELCENVDSSGYTLAAGLRAARP